MLNQVINLFYLRCKVFKLIQLKFGKKRAVQKGEEKFSTSSPIVLFRNIAIIKRIINRQN